MLTRLTSDMTVLVTSAEPHRITSSVLPTKDSHSSSIRGMTTTDPSKLGEYTWEIRDLARNYPPIWQHKNKQIVAAIVGDDAQTAGTITVSRWKGEDLPQTVVDSTTVVPNKGFFSYSPPDANDDSTHWHMNFADPLVFGHGEGPLLAQDELQIVEHPILCSLGKAMESGTHGVENLKRLTREDGQATPVLVQGAPRRCRLLTDRYAIYGDHFAQATEEILDKAVERIDPPQLSNILALSALPPNYAMYTMKQIAEMLGTAYAGFRAIVLQSGGDVTLHTGHWGCGAYGGNKGLIAAIQILAAGMAGVSKMHYWYGFTHQDLTALQHGIQVASLLSETPTLRVVELLDSAGYSWGIANENHVPYEPPKDCLLSRSSVE